ncbi:conserved hypothetical protein [Novosphingobium aromaticivorans DSM 12444]|uniref:Uncharacterized protein n=2 Tax=Novosphingobium aromaticivorans TaxID=48935 RepID=Q2GAN1_NOVAD|nr:conserved hypothetical protein [Novosphingobium aromaticivorans DSM 12444]
MSCGSSDDAPGLFGWTPAPPRGQGRPPYVWSREKSNKLMVLFASGYRQRDAAAVLGCDVKTLRKVFPQECKHQAQAELITRSGLMAKLVELAESGNVSAIRQFDKMLTAERLKSVAGTIVERRKEKPEKLGKKDQAKLAAHEMGGKFGARTPPPRLIN